MRNKTHLWKRSLAALLSFVMVLGMIPAFGMAPLAYAADGDETTTESDTTTVDDTTDDSDQAQMPNIQSEYITLPITIRDFAADGMLFQYNEVDETTFTDGVSTPTRVTVQQGTTAYSYNADPAYWDPTTENDFTGIRVFSASATLPDYSTINLDYWHCIIIDENGYVLKVISNQQSKAYYYQDMAATYNGVTPAYSVWAWAGDGSGNNAASYDPLAIITEGNKACYQIYLDTTNSQLYVDEIKTYHVASTRAFGLMLTGGYDYINNLSLSDETKTISGTQIISNGSFGSSDQPTAVKKVLNSGATQTAYGALVRADLVGPELVDGKPIYTEATVTYLAQYMQQIMAVPYQNADGSYNTYHVMGDKMFTRNADGSFNYVAPGTPEAEYDLAEVLRIMVANSEATDKLGSYAASRAKFTNGKPLLDVETGEVVTDENGDPIMVDALRTYEDVETWFDAAYFLLHNTWRDSTTDMKSNDGYGMPIPKYDRIHLVQATNEDGQLCYVFNAKYDDTTYDFQNGQIYNSDFGVDENGTQYTTVTRPYTIAQDAYGEDFYARGNPLPVNRFDPLGLSGAKQNEGYGMSGNLYGNLTGYKDTWEENYDTTNYNLSLEGHAKFVYHQDANQYFTFTGDDDVYLYIKGVRVLDIGGAHAIAKIRINLNDVAETIGLQDGGTYSFDFYYMERHGTAANFGIETNIQIAEPSLTTTKTGYQGGSSTGYNGYVDPTVPVAYSFNVKNDGDAPIKDLIFDDREIGIYFSPNVEEIQLYPEGETEHCYTIDDMYLYIFNPNGSVKEVYSQGNLTKEIIAEKLAAGLLAGESIGIYGFKYKIPATEWVQDTFTNTVTTTGTSTSTNKTLHAVADWKVQKAKEPLNKFHVYDWLAQNISKNPATQVNNKWYHPGDYQGVNVTVEEILEKTVPAGTDLSNAKVIPCTASGNTSEFNLNPNIKLNKNETTGALESITYKSTIPGVDQVYYKVTGIGKDSLVFNYRVFTFGAVDNIYVLDYGLNVELNGDNFGLLTNDHLNVVGANVNIQTVGISDATFYNVETEQYETSLTLDADGIIQETYGKFTYGEKTRTVTTIDEETEEEVIEEETYLSLMYEPTDIIDNTDAVIAHIEVRETIPEGVTLDDDNLKFYGVDMYELVTTAPASVVYYEESFPGITYVNTEGEDGNQWVHYETVDGDGDPIKGTEQSADQDQQYGYDENYKEDLSVQLPEEEIWSPGEVTGVSDFELDTTNLDALQTSVADALNEYYGYDMGYSGTDSNGTVNILEVKETADVMFFDFVGTGFEIISRTTDFEYAVINVTVYETDADGNIIQIEKTDKDGNVVMTEKKDDEGNIVYETDENDEFVLDTDGNKVPVKVPVMINKIVGMRAVITESKGGDLYQVPIVSITGLERGNYRVSVKAAGSSANKTRVLYIDGVRIYGPLSDGQALEYYNPAEYQADFFAIKELINDGKMTYLSAGENLNGKIVFNPQVSEGTEGSGYTVIENIAGEEPYVLVNATSLGEYMSFGPNNELYLNEFAPTDDDPLPVCNMIMCVLKERTTDDHGNPYPEGARSIQIGAHRKFDDISVTGGWVQMVYGKDAVEMADVDNPNAVQILTGTEMYYPIDVTKLHEVSDGVYWLYIGTNASEESCTTLALTNLKIAGYTVEALTELNIVGNDPDELDKNAFVNQVGMFYSARKAAYEESHKADDTPVNENLSIVSAALRTGKVYSGKTATLTVKAGADANTLVVTDANGNEVTPTKCTRKVSGGSVIYTFIWTVTGTKGEAQDFKVRVYDADGLASVNSETVTVTIR